VGRHAGVHGSERWNGGTITAATDQFAFCVALWEALAGQRPFAATVEELRAAVTAGPAKLDASEIRCGCDRCCSAGSIRIRRGWPSMSALLVALRPDRRKLYVGFGAVAGLGLSASVIALALTRGPAGEPARRKTASNGSPRSSAKDRGRDQRSIDQAARQIDQGFRRGQTSVCRRHPPAQHRPGHGAVGGDLRGSSTSSRTREHLFRRQETASRSASRCSARSPGHSSTRSGCRTATSSSRSMASL
jgi:hypothetical protein